jgi:hypothetical protein
MGINLLPLRLGELARAWFLDRETGVRTSAVVGTIVAERALDLSTLVLIGGVVLYLQAGTFPAWVRTGALIISAFGLAPLLLIVALRLAEERTMAVLGLLVRPLPEGMRAKASDILTQVCLGLNALHSLRAAAMVFLESFFLWGVLLPGAFLLGLIAFHVDLPPRELVLAAYTAHLFVSLAVAAPAAPGFFGVYHFAAREALLLFAVPSTVAVGFGTVMHLCYWVPITLAGLFSMLQAGAHFGDLSRPVLGKAPSDAHR